MTELGVNPHLNKFCIYCEKDTLSVSQQDKYMVTTCSNCGVVCASPYKPTWYKFSHRRKPSPRQ